MSPVNSQIQFERRRKVEKWLNSRPEDIPQSWKRPQQEVEGGEGGSDGGSDTSTYEVNLKQVKQFILGTEAFKILKISLRLLIYPSDDLESRVMKTSLHTTPPKVWLKGQELERLQNSLEQSSS